MLNLVALVEVGVVGVGVRSNSNPHLLHLLMSTMQQVRTRTPSFGLLPLAASFPSHKATLFLRENNDYGTSTMKTILSRGCFASCFLSATVTSKLHLQVKKYTQRKELSMQVRHILDSKDHPRAYLAMDGGGGGGTAVSCDRAAPAFPVAGLAVVLCHVPSCCAVSPA